MKAFIHKHSRLLMAAAFLLLFLIGLLTAPDYGIYFDQQSEMVILRENMKEYAHYLLGDDSPAVQYYDSIGLPRITETVEIDHGMAAFYPLAPLMIRMDTDQPSLFPLWNMLAWCWFMAGVLALYGLCRKLGMNRLAAFAGALMLYLCPRFFAEGHYNNKDMVLLSLSLLTMYFGTNLWEKPTILRGILFAFFGALATNTKIIGICIFGAIGLGAVVLLTTRRQWNKRTMAATFATLISFAAFYALLTPAMWQNPLDFFRHLIANATGFTRWNNNVLFRSAIFRHSDNPLPFYYLPYYLLVSTPIFVVALAAVGQLLAIWYCWRQRKELLQNHRCILLLCATLIWAAPLFYAMFSNPVVYNGWRHFYFVFAGLAVLAAWGFHCLIRFMQKHGKACQRTISCVLTVICFLTSAIGIALNHPYQYGYINAVGAILNPGPLEEGMELDYWNVSLVDALEEAIDQIQPTAPLSYSAMDPVTYLALEIYHAGLPETIAGKLVLAEIGDVSADLLVINLGYHQMYGSPIPESHQLIAETTSYGNALIRVYSHTAK
ncbi:MAG: hypothetical protein E7323_07370 [Clostridiales bacterium]|nr:hypothetical protein [Clostridiales bacterium]